MRVRGVAAVHRDAARLDDVHRGHHPGDHSVVAAQEFADPRVGDGQRLQVGDGVEHALVAHLRPEHLDRVDHVVDAAQPPQQRDDLGASGAEPDRGRRLRDAEQVELLDKPFLYLGDASVGQRP